MTPIITPALVRRYLLATGWTLDPSGEYWDRSEETIPPDGNTWMRADSVQACLDGEEHPELDRARLGMLAAAEMVREEAQGYEVKSTDEDGPREALLDVASKFIEAAGVDPKAWEKARGA